MSGPVQPKLSSCGCCEGLPALSPETNDPGLSAISYRLGTYASFFRRMIAHIQSSSWLGLQPPPPWALSALTTRSLDDPIIALLDAWAVVADVLTFYQERIANEGFLRTATERLSVLQLAREIGYELSPGVAASAYLALTVEDVIGTAVAAALPQGPKTPSATSQGAPTFNAGVVTIPQGAKVQSIPAQGKLPQTFETSSDLPARAGWNILLPRLTRQADLAITGDGKIYLIGPRAGLPIPPPGTLSVADIYFLNPDTPPPTGSTVQALAVQQIFLAGTDTGIQPADRVLLVGQNSAGAKLTLILIVQNVVLLSAQKQTRVDFAANPVAIPFSPFQFSGGGVPSNPVAFNQDNVNKYVLQKNINESGLQALIKLSDWNPDELATLVNNLPSPSVASEGVFTFGAGSAFFGHNAPLWNTLTNPANKTMRGNAFPESWDAANAGAGRFIWTDSQGNLYSDATAFLERAFPQILAGGWAILEAKSIGATPYQITEVVEKSLADYGLTGKATGLTIQTLQGSLSIGLGSPSATTAGPSAPYDVFAIGNDGNLYQQHGTNGSWEATPENLAGGNLLNAPSAVANGPSPLEVFAVGKDGNLYHRSWDGSSWSGWASLGGGNLWNSPSAVVNGENPLDVFTIGSDGNLYHTYYDGNWNGPSNLGGANPGGPSLINSPAAVVNGPSPVEVFMTGTDGNLYHAFFDGTNWNAPSTFTPAPGLPPFLYSPSAVANSPNPLDLFVTGSDGGLYHAWITPGQWNGPEYLGGSNFVGSPSATGGGANTLDIFTIGTDGNLYHTWWNGAWGGPQNLGGGNLTGSPSAVVGGQNPLDVFAVGTDGNLYHTWWDGALWQGFENLGGGNLQSYLVRQTKAYLQSEQQVLAEFPIADDIPANSTTLMLNGMVLGLQVGRPVALNGIRADAPGVVANEIVILQDISHDGGFTTLEFTTPLQYSYTRASLTLCANVVAATHGETITVPEVLGSGDASQVNQTFTLKRSPLTYVSAPTASGNESTLQVRVNDLLWEEAPSLYGVGPNDQTYITRRSDNQSVTVMFGDGVTGACLPTGQNNISASYRVGIGTDGDVDAGSLSILQTRPPGVRAVTNSLAASGGANPEDLDHARSNAPLTVLTLDRIVSLEDYEHFAAAFAGIGKAQAIALWNGETGLVHLTVAGIEGQPVDATSQLYLSLVGAIDAARDPVQQVRVANYLAVSFQLTATVIIDEPRYIAADVLANVRSALVAAFSFDQRAFAQPVTAAEVISTIQAVPGVIATNLIQLYRSDDNTGTSQTEPPPVLAANFAHRDNGGIVAAELLTINPFGFSVTEKKL